MKTNTRKCNTGEPSDSRELWIKTGLSQAYWCDYGRPEPCIARINHGNECPDGNSACKGTAARATFAPAKMIWPTSTNKISDNTEPHRYISWFDEMFCGGLKIPREYPPLTVLVTGTAGTGKTTLCQELCYNLANNRWDGEGAQVLNKEAMSSWYISLATPTEELRKNAASFGWSAPERMQELKNNRKSAQKITAIVEHGKHERTGYVLCSGQELVERALKSVKGARTWKANCKAIMDMMTDSAAFASAGLPPVFGPFTTLLVSLIPATLPLLEKQLERRGMRALRKGSVLIRPEIVVIDSVDLLDEGNGEGSYIEDFIGLMRRRNPNLKMVLLVQNESSGRISRQYLSFADAAIALGWREECGYRMRTFQILKARYQSHVGGEHQFGVDPPRNPSDSRLCDNAILHEQGFPFKTKGGVSIYPSMHYFLSMCKRRRVPSPPTSSKVWPESLNSLVKLPSGRCTAFVGSRGTHKSDLAYMQALRMLSEYPQSRAIIISLREDEKHTAKTLDKFIRIGNFHRKRNRLKNLCNVSTLVQEQRLVLMHCLPSAVSSNIFFLRLFTAIQRMRTQPTANESLMVIFNSVDRLPYRYPVCAKDPLFIAGIVEQLNRARVTSLFVCADVAASSDADYGLLPMSDLILDFQWRRFSRMDYCRHVRPWAEKKPNKVQELQDVEGEIDQVVLEVMQNSGGNRPMQRGILEVVGKSDRDTLFKKSGIYLSPMNAALAQGVRL